MEVKLATTEPAPEAVTENVSLPAAPSSTSSELNVELDDEKVSLPAPPVNDAPASVLVVRVKLLATDASASVPVLVIVVTLAATVASV
jgi:hypothetical protein